jgi:CheY-like chemotaxis protein
MSLDYKVLWIDDNPKTIKSKRNQIEDFLKGEGFRPQIILIENGQDIDRYLDDPLLDLIVTDYYIHEQLDGKQLTEKIRSSEKMIEIILYSQKEGTDLYQEVGALDGVYISNREGLEGKIKDVVRATIRRTQNVSNMRGIVISEAIDVENQIEKIILDYFKGEEDLATKVLKARMSCDFGKKISFLNSILKKINKLSQDKKDNTALEAAKRQTFRDFFETLAPLRDKCKKLCEDVMKPRNMLAHVELGMKDSKKPFLRSLEKGYSEIVIDNQWCKDTRIRLKEHSSNLNEIDSFITQWRKLRDD